MPARYPRALILRQTQSKEWSVIWGQLGDEAHSPRRIGVGSTPIEAVRASFKGFVIPDDWKTPPKVDAPAPKPAQKPVKRGARARVRGD